jgi:MarR family transcriptional regulator, transcriptional regulator for hemolysin
MATPDNQLFRDALSACSRAFKAAATGRMRALGVHPGQNFLLEALRAESSLTTGELARRMHVEVPTAVRMTQRMEAAGLLTRMPDPDDRRRVRLSLTPDGRKAARAVPRLLDDIADQALRGLSSTERRQLVTLLERVRANLDWPPP